MATLSTKNKVEFSTNTAMLKNNAILIPLR